MPYGLERAGGGNMAPQATAIHRMEEGERGIGGRSGDALRSVRMRCGAMYSDMGRVGIG